MGSKYFLFAALMHFALVRADQNQTGFLSIDCGASTSNYIDATTGFTYVSDEGFTANGVNRVIADAYKVQVNEQQFWNVRSFPEGRRNCYTLKPTLGKGTKYAVRARFMYGNYDNEGQPPTFDLFLGVDLWDTVITQYPWFRVEKEIIFFPTEDRIDVCLVNTGYGIPFISVLELRPWNNQTYNVNETGSVMLNSGRYDLNPAINQISRYKEDVYDRLWSPFTTDMWTPINTTSGDNITKNIYQVPSPVMSNAYSPNATSKNLGLVFTPGNSTFKFYFYLHFAEIQLLQANESREFNIYVNDDLSQGPFVPSFLETTTIISRSDSVSSDGKIYISLNQTKNSTLKPLLNAVEIYMIKQLSQIGTDQTDVNAILNIKSMYRVKRNWQGDPCLPEAYLWDGLNCSYNANNPPRIISLTLSSSGLEGLISSYIANLTMLQSLDLSNNNLTGTIPDFLGQLSFLRVINLKGNNLKGPVPAALLERSKNGLSLSADDNVLGNQKLSPPTNETSSSPRYSCSKDYFVPLFASVGGILLRFIL
ncbi:Malectin-like carbohydrate-binding domain containing protein [Parasponia andersonii]|uniref:Malectin-like carbohydrate-binding domain containing protein n=1 Tax=Parasponia andersonii TaxID=3476 RepID=A0A2P5BGF1_PARAD|nr:Malectin-like carbohydrate-binding domain containing protein [Parasponia andersonii]